MDLSSSLPSYAHFSGIDDEPTDSMLRTMEMEDESPSAHAVCEIAAPTTHEQENDIDDSAFACLPLLEYDEKTRVHSLNEKGLAVITQHPYAALSIIAVVGTFRTGKSTIMNRLAHRLCQISQAQMQPIEESGLSRHYKDAMSVVRKIASRPVPPASFKVGHTQNSTTHGINIYCTPIPLHRAEGDRTHCVLILDTEGLTSPERSKDYDEKIFGLAMMLSSVFVFNGGPTFSRDGFNVLSMASNIVCKMAAQSPTTHRTITATKATATAKIIGTTAATPTAKIISTIAATKATAASTGHEKAEATLPHSAFMPSLFWLLRDYNGLAFSNPQDGSPWSPDEQLRHSIKIFDDSVLMPSPANVSSATTRAPRLSDLFNTTTCALETVPQTSSYKRPNCATARCFPLVKPVADARLLSSLERRRDDQLSPTFVSQYRDLADALADQCLYASKKIETNSLYPDTLVKMLKSFVEQLNHSPSAVPLIADCWRSEVVEESQRLEWEAADLWITYTNSIRESLFPDVLPKTEAAHRALAMKPQSDWPTLPKAGDNRTAAMSALIDPIVLRSALDFVCESMDDILEVAPDSMLLPAHHASKPVLALAERQRAVMVAVAELKLQQDMPTIMNEIPVLPTVQQCGMCDSRSSLQHLWSSALLSCVQQSRFFGVDDVMDDAGFDDKFNIADFAVLSWRDFTPTTLSRIWLAAYQQRALPLLHSLPEQSPAVVAVPATTATTSAMDVTGDQQQEVKNDAFVYTDYQPMNGVALRVKARTSRKTRFH